MMIFAKIGSTFLNLRHVTRICVDVDNNRVVITNTDGKLIQYDAADREEFLAFVRAVTEYRG